MPSEREVLPLGEALEAVGASVEADVTEKVYEYWLKKRAAAVQKPLLHELWNAFPWSVCFSFMFFIVGLSCKMSFVCVFRCSSIVL